MRCIENAVIGTAVPESDMIANAVSARLIACDVVDTGAGGRSAVRHASGDTRHLEERVLSPPDAAKHPATMRTRELAEVLLVDDDEDATEILAEALQAVGYRTRVAPDGLQGLARLDEGFPDLIVLDVEMPRLDGPGMALQMLLRDAGRERIPVLLCSGVLSLADLASQVGTPYFLPKPFTLDGILSLVARVLVERTPLHHHQTETRSQ
jgi:two-component system, cell cycle response regulator DivK